MRLAQRLITRVRPALNKSLVAWASVAALLFLASAQPSATAEEFRMRSMITLPDAADLSAQPSSALTLFSQLRTTVAVSSNELALVSQTFTEMKLARHPKGAQSYARKIMANEFGWNLHQYSCLKKLWDHESHWNY